MNFTYTNYLVSLEIVMLIATGLIESDGSIAKDTK